MAKGYIILTARLVVVIIPCHSTDKETKAVREISSGAGWGMVSTNGPVWWGTGTFRGMGMPKMAGSEGYRCQRKQLKLVLVHRAGLLMTWVIHQDLGSTCQPSRFIWTVLSTHQGHTCLLGSLTLFRWTSRMAVYSLTLRSMIATELKILQVHMPSTLFPWGRRAWGLLMSFDQSTELEVWTVPRHWGKVASCICVCCRVTMLY